MTKKQWRYARVPREQYDKLQELSETTEARAFKVTGVQSAITVAVGDMIDKIEHHIKVRRGDFDIIEYFPPVPEPVYPPGMRQERGS